MVHRPRSAPPPGNASLTAGIERRSGRAPQLRPGRELRTRLILVRSGQGDAQGRFTQHDGPSPDDVGLVQARRAAGRLCETVSDVATVLSSRRLPSIETAGIISSVLEVPRAEPTYDLCRDAPGAAEELTQEQMTERFGPNYAFVPGAESWTDYVTKGTDALRSIPSVHPGRTVIGVIESAVVRASFIAFGRMPAPAAKVIMTGHGSITEWSCLVEDDVRTVESWRLERYNDIR